MATVRSRSWRSFYCLSLSQLVGCEANLLIPNGKLVGDVMTVPVATFPLHIQLRKTQSLQILPCTDTDVYLISVSHGQLISNKDPALPLKESKM